LPTRERAGHGSAQLRALGGRVLWGAGFARAREEGTKLGRKRLEHTDAAKVAAIRAMCIGRIARELGVGVGTVLRVTG
jgi:hypothetical protein